MTTVRDYAVSLSLARIILAFQHPAMLLTRYQRIPDSGHPLTEEFAEVLYVRTPPRQWPEGMRRTSVWEQEPVEVREAFRERARRFMAGDMGVGPW